MQLYNPSSFYHQTRPDLMQSWWQPQRHPSSLPLSLPSTPHTVQHPASLPLPCPPSAQRTGCFLPSYFFYQLGSQPAQMEHSVHTFGVQGSTSPPRSPGCSWRRPKSKGWKHLRLCRRVALDDHNLPDLHTFKVRHAYQCNGGVYRLYRTNSKWPFGSGLALQQHNYQKPLNLNGTM